MTSTNTNTFTEASFSLTNRLARILWQIVWKGLASWSPKPMHGFRAMLLSLFGAKVGRGAHIYPKVAIWAPWNLEIGEEAGIADGVILYSQGKIIIGRRAVISQGTHLCAGTHDYEHPGMPLITKPITVGDYAWITAEAFVHGGVTIGDGAVIGARSVVTKDMPEWTVCAGHPCKPLKPRLMRPDKIS